MEKLRFGSFTWPQNPESYQLKWLREPVYRKNESGDMVFQKMGDGKCVVTGKGCFLGSDAYTDFLKLSALCETGAAATLVSPVWGQMKAYLTELTALQEAKKDFVSYSFCFTRANDNGEIPY